MRQRVIGTQGVLSSLFDREQCERRLQQARDAKYQQDFYGEKTDEQWLEVIK